MANVVINDTNLTNIANAIREKNGTTDTYKPSEMADAITNLPTGGGGGYVPTDEELTYSGCKNFSGGANAWILKEYGDRITFERCPLADSQMFSSYPYEVFDADITIGPNSFYIALQQMFYDTGIVSYSDPSPLKEITGTLRSPENVNGKLRFVATWGMFYGCANLRTINDDFIDSSNCFLYKNTTSNYNRWNAAFRYCQSLREIPKFYFEIMRQEDGSQPGVNNASYGYGNLFTACYALNKIEGLYVISGLNNGNTVTSNMFNETFINCCNVSKITFQTNPDGTPLTANWTGQTIDLSQYVGYANPSYSKNYMTGYNSGFTTNDRVVPPQAGEIPTTRFYRDDTINNYYADNGGVAKYGHTEAVETINSLPDTSAAGGGNTIKFYGSQGYYTDWLKGRSGSSSQVVVSSINKLTEEEIAVAAAKGWTVSIT